MAQQAGVALGDQNDNGRVDPGKGLASAFLVAADQPVPGRLQAVGTAANPAKRMPVLPVMQRLGIGKHAGMLGIHIHGRTAQVEKLCFRMMVQHHFTLIVVNGNLKKTILNISTNLTHK